LSLTYEYRFPSESSVFFTASKTVDIYRGILQKSNIQNVFIHKLNDNKSNLEYEVGYFTKKNFGIGISYGNLSFHKKEKYCINESAFTEDGLIKVCESFLDAEYDSKTHLLGTSFYYKVNLFETHSFISNINFTGQIVYAWNNDFIYENKSINNKFRENSKSLNLFYTSNLSYNKSSFFLIPKIELHVGYKI
jgi:hypothetical protein